MTTITNTIDNGAAAVLDCRSGFSLDGTLLGGQCFRWSRLEDGAVGGVVFGRSVVLRRERGTDKIYIYGAGGDIADRLADYLDLSADYDGITRRCIELEPRIAAAAERCPGIHILRQEPWEALCSFLISQNNNIPRIRLIISRLCELCGTEAVGGGYAFPSAESVAALERSQLDGIGCGYRSPYLLSVSAAVASGKVDFESLRTMPVGDARKILLGLHGVGPKVADCFMLYGLHRLECFPKDVWIKRALEGEFRDTPLLGFEYAGIAQQYIFEYMRNKEIISNKGAIL